jgi:hypothetical protein
LSNNVLFILADKASKSMIAIAYDAIKVTQDKGIG